MEAYGEFARVYDMFMDNVDYEEWAEYLIGQLKKYGIEDELANEKSVLLLTGLGTTKRKLKKLEKALFDLCGNNIKIVEEIIKDGIITIEEETNVQVLETLSKKCLELLKEELKD